MILGGQACTKLNKGTRSAFEMLATATVLVLACACLVGCAGTPSSAGASASSASVDASGRTQADAACRQAGSQGIKAGSSRALYQGQASLRIITPEGKAIYIDPYAGEGYDVPADLILVTHAHFDHNGLEKVASRNKDCRVITQKEAVVDGAHPAFELGFCKVTPVQAGFNPLHDANSCVGYVIDLSDGVTIYVTGDTSTTDDMRDGTLAAMGIDYAFWCTDGVFNMGNDEAAEAARMVGAAHDIPYHNDTTNSGEMFDRAAAERFAAPNAMVVLPAEEIGLEK